MTPAQIRALRQALNENRATFGKRFQKSGRTVEGWEQGLHTPDALVQREMQKIAKRRRVEFPRSVKHG